MEQVLYRSAGVWTKLIDTAVQRRRRFRASFALVRSRLSVPVPVEQSSSSATSPHLHSRHA